MFGHEGDRHGRPTFRPIHFRPTYFYLKIFFQSISSKPNLTYSNLIEMNEMNWTKTPWTQRRWTKLGARTGTHGACCVEVKRIVISVLLRSALNSPQTAHAFCYLRASTIPFLKASGFPDRKYIPSNIVSMRLRHLCITVTDNIPNYA